MNEKFIKVVESVKAHFSCESREVVSNKVFKFELMWFRNRNFSHNILPEFFFDGIFKYFTRSAYFLYDSKLSATWHLWDVFFARFDTWTPIGYRPPIKKICADRVSALIASFIVSNIIKTKHETLSSQQDKFSFTQVTIQISIIFIIRNNSYHWETRDNALKTEEVKNQINVTSHHNVYKYEKMIQCVIYEYREFTFF